MVFTVLQHKLSTTLSVHYVNINSETHEDSYVTEWKHCARHSKDSNGVDLL